MRKGGAIAQIHGSRQQIVLSLLLLNAGRVTPTERLFTAVWDEDPPATARSQIQISISKLRAFLAGLGLPEAIVTREPGYLLQVPEQDIDVNRFGRLVALGREAARRQDPAAAVTLAHEALALWRGDALAGSRSRLVQALAMRLDEERLAVTEERIDLELLLGRHREVVGELRDLVQAHPLREKLYLQLMSALYRDGRQADALQAYRQARRVLVEEHGLDPSEALQAMAQAILNGEPLGADQPAATAEPARHVPRQLPVRAKGFVGRSEPRRLLREALPAADRDGELFVVSGPPGVGKTALAVEMAYEMADLFPDGQLFARLHGGNSAPTPPEQVLGYFLRALGVPPATLPADRNALEGLYRSRLAGHRVLVVLDDAANARQVEPLLPAGPGPATIVTSRRPLPVLPNARRFDLRPFSPESSRRLLSQVIGAARVNAEPEAAAAVAEACAHLPLALQIAAAKVSTRRHWQIARMAARLGDESGRLDELSLDGTGVRASIAVSVEALSSPARTLLMLLGALGATDFAGWVAGPLLDSDYHHGADVLDELVDARLAEVQVGIGALARYRLHDLVGVFARELLTAALPSAARHAALHRLLRCWWFLAGQAHRREYGGDFTLPRSATAAWRLPTDAVDELLAEPIRWFESEHTNLVAAVRLAADLGYHDLCCDLAVTSVTYFEARAHREDWRETHEVALEAALRHGNGRAEAVVRYSRAGLALVEQRFAETRSELSAALAWFVAADDAHGRGLALRGLGSIDRLQGRAERAVERYERALVDLRVAGDQVGEAHVLINLAQVLADNDRADEAEELLGRALGICTRLGARRVEAQARHRLGQLHLDRGDLDRADAEFGTVLTIVTTAADPAGKAYALIGTGAVLQGRGELDLARVTLTDALATMRQTGSRIGEGQALLALAELFMRTGELARAAQQLHAADAAFAEIGAAGWLARVRQVQERLERSDRHVG